MATAPPPTPQVDWSSPEFIRYANWALTGSFASSVTTLLQPRKGENILDIGCGRGEITLEIQKLVGDDAVVVGLDISQVMIDAAKQNGVKRIVKADAQDPNWSEEFKGHFDAVFSFAVLHWCNQNPAGVIEGARRSLKRGGRFVGEMGGIKNLSVMQDAMTLVLRTRGYDPNPMNPWFFPSTEDYQKLLEAHGFKVETMTSEPRMSPLPETDSLVRFMRIFCRLSWLYNIEDNEVAERIMEEVEELCKTSYFSDGKWTVRYDRLRFIAVLL